MAPARDLSTQASATASTSSSTPSVAATEPRGRPCASIHTEVSTTTTAATILLPERGGIDVEGDAPEQCLELVTPATANHFTQRIHDGVGLRREAQHLTRRFDEAVGEDQSGAHIRCV